MRIPLLCATVALSGVAAIGPAPADSTLQVGADNSQGCYIPERVAHRLGGGEGSNTYYWENSWKAYDRSLAAGVKIFETDVRWTADGVPVLMHDAKLDRTTNGTGNVADVTIAYVDSLELDNGGGKVPHFEDFLKRAKADNVTVWPEYKPETFNQAWIDDYARLITETGVDAVVPSFSKDALAQFKAKLPNNKQIWFQDVLKDGFGLQASQVPTGAYAGLINISIEYENNMANMNNAGIGVYAWYNELIPSENPDGWSAVARYRPLGLITDYPENYASWASTTTYCAKPKAKCAKLPKKLKADSTVVLMKKTCTTSAGTKVIVKAQGKGKLKRGAKGKVSIVTGAKGKVTLTYSAEGSSKAGPFTMSKKYTVK
jgi:glycerophosphoryl diester phosphodiesterase